MGKRFDTIDAVRGALMVFMLLDHTRDFTHAGAFFNDPLDPATSTPLLYLTRWITHLCAPGFVFLAGMGAGLQRLRGTPIPELARFLWTRGLWLVFLELSLFRVLIWWDVHPSLLAMLQVIWAIGIGMIVLSALVRLPTPCRARDGRSDRRRPQPARPVRGDAVARPGHARPEPARQALDRLPPGRHLPDRRFPEPDPPAQLPGAALVRLARARLWLRGGLRVAGGAAAAPAARAGSGDARRVRRPALRERVRRPAPVGPAGGRGEDGDVLLQRAEVPALARLRARDARVVDPRARPPRGAPPRGRARPRARDVRPRASLLLLPAVGLRAPRGHGDHGRSGARASLRTS